MDNFNISLASQNISAPKGLQLKIFPAFDAATGRVEEPLDLIDRFKGPP